MISPKMISPESAVPDILADLSIVLYTEGFDGLWSVVEEYDLTLRAPYSHPLDARFIRFLTAMAILINKVIEQDSRSILDRRMECFSALLNFACAGKLDLWVEGKASPSDLAVIRSMYLEVLRRSSRSLWPNFLYIFNLAYKSVVPFWISWLKEEIGSNPEREKIQLEQANNDESKGNDLLHQRNEFITRALGTHIQAIFPDALCDPPTASILDEQVITRLSDQARTIRSYDPTKLLRDGGPVYDILNEVDKYLRLNNDMEESLLLVIILTANELIDVCMTYLRLWETNHLLEAQLLEVHSVNGPARHYYRTCFAVNALRPATIPLWNGIRVLYLYAECTDDKVTFVFQNPSSTQQHIIVSSWHEVPYYTRKIWFEVHNANPKAPRVLTRESLLKCSTECQDCCKCCE
jgi:hypothetical protein